MVEKESLESARELSRELAQRIGRLVDATSDYDLERLLKKIEAQVMDIQHNLNLACRISQGGAEGSL